MRADAALKKSKIIIVIENYTIMGVSGGKAELRGNTLWWLVSTTPVPFSYIMRTDWEPVPCDCKVCEAKVSLEDDSLYGDFDPGEKEALRTVIDNAKCLNEL